MSAPAQSKPARPVTFATSKDGTQIAFERFGEGPPLIIVGGALSHRGGGKPLAAALADHFTAYTYDRRGRGESSDTKPYAVDREIEDLEALIEQAGGRAHLYGVSSGGALSLRAASKLGSTKVARLGVYEAPFGQDEREFNDQKRRVEQLVRGGKPGEAAAFFLSAIGMPPAAIDGMKRSPEWEAIRKSDFTLVYDYAILGDGRVPDAIKDIRVPALVLDGEKTLPFMHATADRIAELIPNARRKTLEGQTHQASPELVAPLLIEFFGEGSGPRPMAER